MKHIAPISYREWKRLYRPIVNPFNACGRSFYDFLFDYHSEKHNLYIYDHCKKTPNTIWTWFHDENKSFVLAGEALANRIAYLITEIPYASEESAPEVRMGYLSRWF